MSWLNREHHIVFGPTPTMNRVHTVQWLLTTMFCFVSSTLKMCLLVSTSWRITVELDDGSAVNYKLIVSLITPSWGFIPLIYFFTSWGLRLIKPKYGESFKGLSLYFKNKGTSGIHLLTRHRLSLQSFKTSYNSCSQVRLKICKVRQYIGYNIDSVYRI